LAAVKNAADPEDARTRLRSALRRVVEEIRLLVVPRGTDRFAAVQVYFTGDGSRTYLIFYRPAHHGYGGRREAKWWPLSLPPSLTAGTLDLRDPADVTDLAAALEAMPLPTAR
jgi:hypothetical protein